MRCLPFLDATTAADVLSSSGRVTPLQVLEAVLQNYPKDATSYEVLSRRDVIHSLEAESGLTELLLR